jgi:hypothetical protein
MCALVVCAPVLFSSLSSAAGTEPETPQQAWTQAYENNPSLEAQRASLRATDEQVSETLSHWRPSSRAKQCSTPCLDLTICTWADYDGAACAEFVECLADNLPGTL